jgi:hypothetical protein
MSVGCRYQLEISFKKCVLNLIYLFSSRIHTRPGWLFGLLWWSWNNWKGTHIDSSMDTRNIIFYFDLIFRYLWNQIGTDIEDFKCSWLVVKALELSNEEQKKVLHVSELLIVSCGFFPSFLSPMIKPNYFLWWTGELWEAWSSKCC